MKCGDWIPAIGRNILPSSSEIIIIIIGRRRRRRRRRLPLLMHLASEA